MPTSYGQYCPVAKAMEVLDERWTLLIVRELMLGSQHFNALRRGVPRMSPALLSKRLQMLVRSGVVERRQDGARMTYHLTEAGRELEPIVLALGRWGCAGSTSWVRRTSTRTYCCGTSIAAWTSRPCRPAAASCTSSSPARG